MVVANLGNRKQGVVADATGDLQSIGGTTGGANNAAMAIEQRQRNDPCIEHGAQFTGARALSG